MAVQSVPTVGQSALALVLCAVAYGYAFPYFPEVNNPNENVRVYMTAAIAENGSYDIEPMRKRWGWTNDAAVLNGKAFSVKGPATSLLGVPAYWVYYRWLAAEEKSVDLATAVRICRVSATIIPWLFFLVAFQRWLGKHTRSAFLREATLYAVAIGSPLYAYGLLFVSHTTMAAAAFASFMITFNARERVTYSAASAFFAGFFAGMTTCFEYQGLVASVVLTLYAITAVRSPSHVLAYILGGLVPALAVMHFQWAAFGSPFTPGHLYLEDPYFRALHHRGFFGWTGFQRSTAASLLFDFGYGLLPLCPLLLAAVLGLGRGLVRYDIRTDVLFAFAVAASTFLAVSSLDNWRGGWTVGPRLIMLTVPFLAWLALLGLDWLAERLPSTSRVFALSAVVAGIVASGIPSVYYPHIPEQFVRPLPQLFDVLIRHDFAPLNEGNRFDLWGTLSMAPVFAVFALAVAWIASREWNWRTLLAFPLAAAMLYPLVTVPPDAPKYLPTVARVVRKWNPPGHDRAALLEVKVTGSEGTDADVAALAETYKQEGRTKEAKALLAPASNH
ncbi:MAG: hypothetical protein R3A78_16520 [Polyangiales bacterium]